MAGLGMKSIPVEEADKAELQYHKGLDLLRNKRQMEAIPFLKAAHELDPTHKKAQVALQGALESVNWNTAYFCEICGGFLKPKKDYPEITFDDFCPSCGHTPTSSYREKAIGFAELMTKAILLGMFPIATFIFCVFPTWTYKGGGFYMEQITVIAAIYLGANLTPLFILITRAIDPTGLLMDRFFNATLNSLAPLNTIHPFLFSMVEILILFLVIYLSFLFILTPIFYMHRKGYWRTKTHQKNILLITLIFVVIVVVGRCIYVYTHVGASG